MRPGAFSPPWRFNVERECEPPAGRRSIAGRPGKSRGEIAHSFHLRSCGARLPRSLGTLGLAEPELSRHIAWDIGVYGVTTQLAKAIDATYVFQPYSRLVIDCNRKPRDAQSIVTVSDGTTVPGNGNLSDAERRDREREILDPYHREIERVLADRAARRQPTAIFAMHSCTDRLEAGSGTAALGMSA